jgi:serine/threonine protein kinase
LIDFGIATYNKKENLKKYGNVGTLIYQPPEQVMNKFNYGKMADLWACGIIAF